MEKRVQVLVLDFISADSHELLGFGARYALKLCIGFKSLKVLYLGAGEVLVYFGSHSPLLERLSVSDTESLVSLRVAGPSIGLKCLELKNCGRLKRVEICDTNLVSFSSIDDTIDLLLSNVPLLVEVPMDCITFDYVDGLFLTFTLSCCFSQLETLTMDISGLEYNADLVLPILSNLKHLKLVVFVDYDFSLRILSSFLKASPHLQKLVLMLEFVRIDVMNKVEEAAKCPHRNLKVIEVVGYRGRKNAVEHVMYLIRNAVGLQKLVIDPINQWPFNHTYRTRQTMEEGRARDHAAMNLLKNRVPSNIEFVCL